MGEKFKFSVLMSVYKNDKADEVENAIASLLMQTVLPSQIVIVQDGSLSREVDNLLQEYRKNAELFTFVELKENVGLGNALNIGLNYCNYEYVARMDSDDFSLPDRFEKQMSYLKLHPEVDVLGGYIEEYDERLEKSLAIRQVPISLKEIRKVMKTRNGMNHVTVIYKKSKVMEAGNYKDCLYFEDYYLWCRMLKEGMIFHNLNDILVNVRTGNEMYKRRGGMTYSKSIINFEKKIQKINYINIYEYWKNITIRLIVSNMPNGFRSIIYKKKLRKQEKV